MGDPVTTAAAIGAGGSILGGMMAGNAAENAAQTSADAQLRAGQMAAEAAKFRPVGVTNTFGTSNFQFSPEGYLTSAGYQLSPQLQGAQNYLMGNIPQTLQDQANIQAMGRQYLSQSPQEQAQQYMANQQALLAPSREQQSANLMNQLSNTGRTGLSVAQGGGLGMANPEYQALANARAMQDLQLAAQATQAGQQQYEFGQGLLSSAYQPYTSNLAASATTEALGQQPFDFGTALGAKQSTAGANVGQSLLTSGIRAANTAQAGQFNPLGYGLMGAASNPNVNVALGKLFSGPTAPGSYTGSAIYDGSAVSPGTYLYDNPNLLWGS